MSMHVQYNTNKKASLANAKVSARPTAVCACSVGIDLKELGVSCQNV